MARRRKSPAHPWLAFLALSVCAGLLTAGLAVPPVALGISTTKIAADSMQYLPTALATPLPAEKSTVYMADGSVLATFYDQNRTYVPLADIAPVMRQAQVAIEDRRFYEHGAVDMQGLLRAIVVGLLGGQQQGASSLTQQYVKQVRIQTAMDAGDKVGVAAASAPTISRKIVEMRYAIALEQQFTKDQILERYLNMVYYGDNAYGVESAAVHYFGVHAAALTLPQAAMIAGLAQNPSKTDPIHNPEGAISRRNAVLDAMADVGYITQAQADATKAVPFDPTRVVPMYQGCANAPTGFEFLCDYVKRVLLGDQMMGLGTTAQEREATLNRGGLQIHTLISPSAQQAALTAVNEYVAPTDPVIAATAVVQPSTGLIIAMAQSRPWGNDPTKGQTNWNYVVDNNMGGAEGFQAGSTFKIFTLAAALSQGAPFSTVYPAPSKIDVNGWTFQTCSGPLRWTTKQNGPYIPENEGRAGYGEITLQTALTQSVNTYFIQLEHDVGLCSVVRMAQAAGVKAAIPQNGGTDLVDNWGADRMPSFTLGSVEISPLTEAEAYATFANGGIHCDPIILESIEDRDGKPIAVPSANCQQTIEPDVAAGVSQGLSQVISRGSASGNRVPGYAQAGKTGTSENRTTEWLAGYTPEVATAAMIAIDRHHEYWLSGKHKQSLQGLRLPVSGTYFTGISGNDAGKLWKPVMTSALEGRPATAFPAYIPIKGPFKSSYTPMPTPTDGEQPPG